MLGEVKRQQGKQYEVMHTGNMDGLEYADFDRDFERSKSVLTKEFLKERGGRQTQDRSKGYRSDNERGGNLEYGSK